MLSGQSLRLRFSAANLAVSAKRSCSANGRTAKYRAYGLKNWIWVPLIVFFSAPRLDVWNTSIDGPFNFSLLSTQSDKLLKLSLLPNSVGKSSRNSTLPVKSCGQYKWPLTSFPEIVDRLIAWSSRTIWNENHNFVNTFDLFKQWNMLRWV